MREEWKAEIIKRLFKYEISRDELAKEAQMTTSYLNMILAGMRNPADAESKVSAAMDRLVSQKKKQVIRNDA